MKKKLLNEIDRRIKITRLQRDIALDVDETKYSKEMVLKTDQEIEVLQSIRSFIKKLK